MITVFLSFFLLFSFSRFLISFAVTRNRNIVPSQEKRGDEIIVLHFLIKKYFAFFLAIIELFTICFFTPLNLCLYHCNLLHVHFISFEPFTVTVFNDQVSIVRAFIMIKK